MTDRLHRAGTVAIVGAVLAAIGNAGHPIIAGDATDAEILREVADASAYWTPLHLLIALGTVLIVAALIMALPVFEDEVAILAGGLAAVTGAIGGTVAVLQLGALDGVALPGAIRAGADASTVSTLVIVDTALLTLWIALFLGVAVLLFNVAVLRTPRFPNWIGWLGIVGGIGGIVAGTIQAVDGISNLTVIWLLRPVATITVVALLAVGINLRKRSADA